MAKKILVVDDEVELSEILAFQLEDEGYDVTLARSAADGLSAFHEFLPDIVLSDMQMPGGTGLDLLQMIKDSSVQHNYRFFIISGFLSMGDEELKEKGVQAVISKPTRFENILKVIQGPYSDLTSLD